MTLRARLLLAQVPLALALLVVGVVVVRTIGALGQGPERIFLENYRSALAAARMQIELARLQGDEKAAGAFEQALETQEHNITEPGEADATRELRMRWQAYRSRPSPELQASVRSAVDRIVEINQEAIARKSELARITAERSRTLLIAAALAALAIAALASVSLTRRAVRELLEARETLQAAIDGLPDPVLVLDPRGDVTNANQSARALMGPALPPEVRAAVERVHAHVVEGKGPYLPGGFDEAIRVGDKALLPRATPLHSAGGSTVVLQDVTRLLRFDELKSDLVATVAHELRTPLTSLRMTIEMMLDGKLGPIGARQHAMLAASRDDCARLQGIAEDLLNLSRIEAGKVEMSLSACPARDLIGTAVAARTDAAREARVTLESRVDAEPRALADRDRIALVFDNLIGNAIRYSPPGARVEVTAQADGPGVRFEVRDQGPGIPAEYRQRIFDKFFRVPGTKGEGVGLGLYLSREIVRAHGGETGVESEPGQGSRFWFTLRAPGH